jgi:glycine/D-amino acid oxidase-like deaminating enzyme
MGRYDAIVIGAGIVGAACAYEFARANLRVAIVDENDPGSGATDAGMGHLLIMGDSEAEFVLTRYSLELWRSLADSLPSECGYWECGTIWVAADEKELKLAQRKCEYYNSNGVTAELLDVRQIADAEPNLRPALAGALLVQRDAAIHPRLAVRFLLDSALQKGAELITGKRAVSLNDTGVRLSDGTSLSAGSFINATGTAASVLTPGLPIRARKGHIMVAAAGPNFARHQIVELGYLNSVHTTESDSVAFNVRQKTTDELLIGSSRQYGVEEGHVEPAILDRMLSRAIEYMPRLANARQIRSWAGFRAGTPDGLPLIGRCSGFERVYAATGHEGVGVTASLATARLLRDEILNQAPALDSTPYSPLRFDNEEMKQR